MATIEEIIEKKVGEVRIETLDISFGELISLFKEKEFIIEPDFQRLFRWSQQQSSRLIESIILKLPIPQIFVIEGENNVLELVDGLQRISSVIQFIEPEILEFQPLVLEGCDIIPQLDGKTFKKLSVALRLGIKRSTVRAVVIKRQNTSMLRYEMFKRLNTGGSGLAEQEIRNCTARMVGEIGKTFYEFLIGCSDYKSFAKCISTLPDTERDQRGDEELVLRYFALKNYMNLFKGSVRDWLDDAMEAVIIKKKPIDYIQERTDFRRLFDYLAVVMGRGAFVRYRGRKPIGGLAPAHFEAVTLGVWRVIDDLEKVDDGVVRTKIIDIVQSKEFRQFVGPGSNSLTKFKGRVDTVQKALSELI